MREQYIRVGEGFLLVFSLTDRRSLDECTKLHRDILRIKDSARIPMLLVGNKSDLPSTGVDIQARAAAATMQIPYFETSARTRLNIDETFVELVRIIRRNKASDQLTPTRPSKCKEQRKHRQSSFSYSCAIL
jgi:GTPase SAR1 family protein